MIDNREAQTIFDGGVHYYNSRHTDQARGAFRKYLSLYGQSSFLRDPNEGELRASLARIAPRVRMEAVTPSLLQHIVQSQLLICDLEAACEIAAHLERWVAHVRRQAHDKGTLCVLLEDYLWSFGDTAFRPDAIHRLRSLGWMDWFPVIIDATNGRRIVNRPLLACWHEQHFPVIYDPDLLKFVLSCADTTMRNQGEYYPVRRDVVVPNVYACSEAMRVNPMPSIKPVVECDLKKIGIEDGDWFACFHVRENGYYGDAANTEKSGKNGDIATYVDGIRAVLKAGGKAVRLGDRSMRPLAEHPGVIDIAHSAAKSPELDTYLCAKARFVVCGASGPAGVAAAFGTPLVVTNAFPVDMGGIGVRDIVVPKMLIGPDQKPLEFQRGTKPPFHEMRWTGLLAERGVTLRDNTPDEIEGAVKEMIAITAGGNPFWEEDRERQGAYHVLTVDSTRPQGMVGTASAHFLRKHEALIGSQKEAA